MPGIRFEPQISFDMERQQGNSLCWVAVAVSVERHFDAASTLRQCELIGALLHVPGSCCSDEAMAGGPVPARCDKTGGLEVALGDAPGVRHLEKVLKGELAFAEVQSEISSGLPVCAYISWGGGEGHFILISGCNESNGNRYLYVKDPLHGDSIHSYADVVSHYRLIGKWKFTYKLKKA